MTPVRLESAGRPPALTLPGTASYRNGTPGGGERWRDGCGGGGGVQPDTARRTRGPIGRTGPGLDPDVPRRPAGSGGEGGDQSLQEGGHAGQVVHPVPGAGLAGLGRFYAEAVVASAPDFDVLLGPAYKGIPIASATAVQLSERHGRDVPWCFNRKEAKDHGEGGSIVDLVVGEPDFDTLRSIQQAAARAMENGATRYTALAGTLELRRVRNARAAADFS